jgi:hypothetical protein
MVKDQRPGLGMPFVDNDTSVEGGLFISARVFFLYDAIHGWMTGQMDGWKKLHNHDVLYYM